MSLDLRTQATWQSAPRRAVSVVTTVLPAVRTPILPRDATVIPVAVPSRVSSRREARHTSNEAVQDENEVDSTRALNRDWDSWEIAERWGHVSRARRGISPSGATTSVTPHQPSTTANLTMPVPPAMIQPIIVAQAATVEHRPASATANSPDTVPQLTATPSVSTARTVTVEDDQSFTTARSTNTTSQLTPAGPVGAVHVATEADEQSSTTADFSNTAPQETIDQADYTAQTTTAASSFPTANSTAGAPPARPARPNSPKQTLMDHPDVVNPTMPPIRSYLPARPVTTAISPRQSRRRRFMAFVRKCFGRSEKKT